MADRRANLDIGFDQRSTQALRVSALNVGAIQVADEILGKFHAVFLKQQYTLFPRPRWEKEVRLSANSWF